MDMEFTVYAGILNTVDLLVKRGRKQLTEGLMGCAQLSHDAAKETLQLLPELCGTTYEFMAEPLEDVVASRVALEISILAALQKATS